MNSPIRGACALTFLALCGAVVGCTSSPGSNHSAYHPRPDGEKPRAEHLGGACPKNAEYKGKRPKCECKRDFVQLTATCLTLAEANASCGPAYEYDSLGIACVARTCPAGQVLNAQDGSCENQKDSDAAVAAKAGLTLKAGQTIGCPADYTYVVNNHDGACIPNELTCGAGKGYEVDQCVSERCPLGTVWERARTNASAVTRCMMLAAGEDKTAFRVEKQLSAAMGSAFCAPHAKNPGGFKVAPGGQTTITIAVTISIPGNEIEQTRLVGVKTTMGGAELTPEMYPGVANVVKQVNDQVVAGIRALGGRSVETQASAEVSCVIKRAPVVVVEAHSP